MLLLWCGVAIGLLWRLHCAKGRLRDVTVHQPLFFTESARILRWKPSNAQQTRMMSSAITRYSSIVFILTVKTRASLESLCTIALRPPFPQVSGRHTPIKRRLSVSYWCIPVSRAYLPSGSISRDLYFRPRTISQIVSLRWRHNERDGVSNHQPHDCLLKHLFRHRSKETSKLRVTGLCVGNSPVTGEFPAQRASNAEHVPIWWRHHAYWLRNDASSEKCKVVRKVTHFMTPFIQTQSVT